MCWLTQAHVLGLKRAHIPVLMILSKIRHSCREVNECLAMLRQRNYAYSNRCVTREPNELQAISSMPSIQICYHRLSEQHKQFNFLGDLRFLAVLTGYATYLCNCIFVVIEDTQTIPQLKHDSIKYLHRNGQPFKKKRMAELKHFLCFGFSLNNFSCLYTYLFIPLTLNLFFLIRESPIPSNCWWLSIVHPNSPNNFFSFSSLSQL